MQNNNTATNSPRATRTGNAACAACKYQRRKCAPDCILAPYFPQDRHKQFINALRLFGVGKLINAIKNVEPPIRNVTMSTIMYQSDARAMDPVGGCYRIIQDLQAQIEYHNHELSVILQQLAVCRAQFSDQFALQNQFGDPNFNGFQDEISVWSDSIPMSSLTLQDNKEEIFAEDDDQKHVLDLINEMNSDFKR